MKRLLEGFILLSLICCCGCSHLSEYVKIAKSDALSDNYFSELNRWTRQKTIYAEFDTQALIVATYKSKEFGDAYREEYSRIYQVPKGEEGYTVGYREQGSTEFLFYASCPDKDANDFARDTSVWNVFLLSETGERSDPSEIREVMQITPAVKSFFPYVNHYYGRFYSVRFARPEKEIGESEKLQLVFAGVLGRAELKWGY